MSKALAFCESLYLVASKQFRPTEFLGHHDESTDLQDLKHQAHQVFQSQLQYLVRQLNPWARPSSEVKTYKHRSAKQLKLLRGRGFGGLELLQCHQMNNLRGPACLVRFRFRSWLLSFSGVVRGICNVQNIMWMALLQTSGSDLNELAILLQISNCW